MTERRRFRRAPGGPAGAVLLGVLAFVAIFSPLLATDAPLLSKDRSGLHVPALAGVPIVSRWFSTTALGRVLLRAPVPYGPDAVALDERLQGPSSRHLLGTDDLGRDLLARMIAAAPLSLGIGVLAATTALLVGLAVGGLAGYFGGIVDLALSRLIDIFLAFPTIVLLLALLAFLTPSAATVALAIGLTSWPEEARYIRAEVLKLRSADFVLAARVAGAGPARILVRELAPNILAPVLVSAAFGGAEAVMAESALSFLGLGVLPPQLSWGSILAQAPAVIEQAWWMALFPGLAIFTTVASYNLIGEAWRAALDVEAVEPRLARLEDGA